MTVLGVENGRASQNVAHVCVKPSLRMPAFVALVFAASLIVAASQATAAPTITKLTPRGLQIGGTTTIVIEGGDLLPPPRIELPLEIASQKVRDGATPQRVEIDVVLAEQPSPGIYNLRVANDLGISNAVAIGVDRLPQRHMADDAGQLPAALHGELADSQIARAAFSGKAGEQIVVDVEARRLGSKLRPTVHLYDERGVQLGWSQARGASNEDARLAVTLPADGRYTVELHDQLYRGAQPGFYRLKVGQLHYADIAFPMSVPAAEGAQRFEFAASNLAEAAEATESFERSQSIAAAPWPSDPLLTGARPAVHRRAAPHVAEARENAQPQTLSLPVVVNGRIAAAGEQDVYLIPVQQGQKLRCEILARDGGSPLDALLSIRKADGAELAAGDDRPNSSDPAVDFDVPEGQTQIQVVVRDLLSRGGRDFVYALAIAPTSQADFRLEIDADRHHLPRGGNDVVRIRAIRNGYDGPIRLDTLGLPSGVMLSGDEIPAGATEALFSLLAGDVSPAQAVTQIVGRGTALGPVMPRAATLPVGDATAVSPWLREELGVAVAGPAPLELAWDLPATSGTMPRGTYVEIPATVRRSEGIAGPVRLSLMTSQPMPKKKVDNNEVDDVDRALRLDGAPVIAADQTTTPIRLVVPADLRDIPYDLVLKGELLSDDRQQVRSVVYTPARRLRAATPFKIQLAGEPRANAAAGTGATGEFKGRVVRTGGFQGDVTVTLVGLPAEYAAPSVVVPGNQADFALPVRFPYATPAAVIEGLRLTAATTLAPDRQATANELAVSLNVVPGGPPPALYPVFEDDNLFAVALNEGGGKAEIDSADRYSGTSAVRVTPDQRFRTRLPGLGVAIRENPGEGQYRYVRFAWKKRGGGNVLLQFNAGGEWGPARGSGKPGYRYEAGPALNAFDAEATRISEQLPEQWEVVTRDLFADFGEFELSGLAITPGDGEYAAIDHLYLGRTPSDFDACPKPVPQEPPYLVFDDQPEFVEQLTEGGGTATLDTADKQSGAVSVRVTPDQRFTGTLPWLGVKIRERPGPGEFRYLQFAWKKRGGDRICLQLNHDGAWGPLPDKPGKFRYDATAAADETYGAAVRVDGRIPEEWVVVTRDLFADFGEFTLSGLALSPFDGEYASFDRIYLARQPQDFSSIAPAAAIETAAASTGQAAVGSAGP